jgi:N-acetylmuramic acid 6-phosphate etherase
MPQTSTTTTLGIEGGGTKTDWVLLDEAGTVLSEGQLPAASMKLSSDEQLAHLFSLLPRDPARVGVFLAGCLIDRDRARLRRLANAAWPQAQLRVGSDGESGFATALGTGDGIVVVSGTGAVVHGRRGGKMTKAGGWGHILGDRGGAYDLARHALRKVMLHYDLYATVTPLGANVLAALSLNELPQLVDWIHDSDKMDVARLAPVVIRAAKAGDEEMRSLVSDRAHDLALFSKAVAQRLGLERPEVRLFGGLLTREPYYAAEYRRHLETHVPGAHVELCTRSGAHGAATLVRALAASDAASPAPVTVKTANAAPAAADDVVKSELAAAATEQRHPRSQGIENLSSQEMVSLFVEEEDRVRAALAACADRLAAGVDLITAALREGGRLFYIGAGTSGRLGVLDASEMPPTFGTAPELVQGLIAGGAPALTRSAEAAEDSRETGAATLASRGVRAGDVVCGITASGRTPFVLGALAGARQLGAKTMLLSCNPARHASPEPWDVEIDLPTGPEIVTGSTRLKAGTATKVALNILSSCTMIRLGHVRGGAMVDVRATNVKLRDRAMRIVSATLGVDLATAQARLEASEWSVRAALDGK